METQPWVPEDVFARMVALRRDLHRHPELSGAESASAVRVGAALDALGLPWRGGVGGHGILLDLPGRHPAPIVALRADLDALPIHEETGLSFSSTCSGVMHACGHDGHSAMLLGAAALLSKRGPPPGPLRLIWQPAEEQGTGARRIIEAGGLDGVSAIFGGHIDPRFPVGALVVDEGAVNASSDGFHILVRGRGGHAARPHEGIDPVVVACHLVVALQTIVSRGIDPAQAAVLTVGRIQGGRAANIIADTAELEGTLRALKSEVRAQLLDALNRRAHGIAAAHGANTTITLIDGTPPVINGPAGTALARAAAWDVVGAEGVTRMGAANMGSEDFGYYLQRIPGAFIRFGAGFPDRPPEPAHSPRFDLDERCLGVGAAWMARVAWRASEGQVEGAG